MPSSWKVFPNSNKGKVMEYSNVIFEHDGPVAFLTINRPDKRNALNMATRLEISAILDSISHDETIMALVVTGAGDKAFIAGSDLTELSGMSPDGVYDFARTYGQRLYTRFEDLDIPVIAMVNGLCLGGGLEVAMACDIRIASDKAVFGQPELFLGIIPGSGATQRLPRLVGPGRARQMVFTGDTIDAQEAYRSGLVNQVAPAEELRSVVMDIARKIVSRGRVSLKMAKRSLLMSQEIGVSAGLAFESLAQVACFSSPDRDEGMAAFFEKRKPVFNREEKVKKA